MGMYYKIVATLHVMFAIVDNLKGLQIRLLSRGMPNIKERY